MTIQEILSFIPKTGDGVSWVTQKIIVQLATWGLAITELQTKILLIIIFGIVVYLFISVLTVAKKLLKWGIISLAIFLAISIAISIFA